MKFPTFIITSLLFLTVSFVASASLPATEPPRGPSEDYLEMQEFLGKGQQRIDRFMRIRKLDTGPVAVFKYPSPKYVYSSSHDPIVRHRYYNMNLNGLIFRMNQLNQTGSNPNQLAEDERAFWDFILIITNEGR